MTESPQSSLQSTAGDKISAVKATCGTLKRRRAFIAAIIVAFSIVALWQWLPLRVTRPFSFAAENVHFNAPRSQSAARIVEAARAQIGTRYDAAYVVMSYPRGDVPVDRGACTDVVIRALRGAGVDLQQLIHRDMSARFADYPPLWGLKTPNPNIDHRRVPNQIEWMRRHARELTRDVTHATLNQWQPGDIVFWQTGARQWHTGVLSDRADDQNVPLVIHNGSICREENCLTRWPIIGHFRLR